MKRAHHDSNHHGHHDRRHSASICEMTAETKASVARFNESIRDLAFHAIKTTLPCKIIELTEIIKQKEELRELSLKPAQWEGTITLAELTNGTENVQKIRQELNQLQRAIHESMQTATDIKVWLQMNIPRIEDGNNFGVDIQEGIVQELGRAEDAGLGAFEGLGRWWQLRSELINKIIKFGLREDCSRGQEAPHLHHGWNCSACRFRLDEPGVYALLDSDKRFLGNIWMGWMDLRNNYAVLNDLITKNIEKLVNPRSENTSNMY